MHIKTSSHKQGFGPIADKACRLLVLGSMPGEESLRLQEYYGHKQNLFWKIISMAKGQTTPSAYEEKKTLLLSQHIAVWDACEACVREGSLDTAIREVIPNGIHAFLASHPAIHTVLFNGQKAAAVHDKLVGRLGHITYVVLPSTSPANAGIAFAKKLYLWKAAIASAY